MYGNIQVRFLRGKGAARLPTYLTTKDFNKNIGLKVQKDEG
jgi:hypothetical protein